MPVFPFGGLHDSYTNAVYNWIVARISSDETGVLRVGTGVPAAGVGANGDFYFRTDTPGTPNQRMYIKAAGSWTALTL